MSLLDKDLDKKWDLDMRVKDEYNVEVNMFTTREWYNLTGNINPKELSEYVENLPLTKIWRCHKYTEIKNILGAYIRAYSRRRRENMKIEYHCHCEKGEGFCWDSIAVGISVNGQYMLEVSLVRSGVVIVHHVR